MYSTFSGVGLKALLSNVITVSIILQIIAYVERRTLKDPGDISHLFCESK